MNLSPCRPVQEAAASAESILRDRGLGNWVVLVVPGAGNVTAARHRSNPLGERSPSVPGRDGSDSGGCRPIGDEHDVAGW